ncbi:carboxy methyl transferase for protein phosphatase 2A [Pleurotus ostreatus]|nr:carboxy methyl transferase for protein phosphatase 2A [Pleurotus ostreatus]
MTPEASAQLVQWFVDYFSSTDNNTNRKPRVLGGIVYEMFGLNDPFGRVMVNNLKTRNVSLPGAEPYPTMQSLPKRFLQHGFRASHALSLRELRASHLGTTELERISKLEMLDEVEELELVLEHYAITWGAWIDGTGETKADWAGWGLNQAVAAQPVDSDTSE